MEKVDAIMEGLRRDVLRWKMESERLRVEGADDLADRVDAWIKQGVLILERWQDFS